MSAFGADTSDFHSDFSSDFRTEGNDYASDFRDFPGDFGGAPRAAKQPPEAPETAPPDHGTAADKSPGEQGRRQAGSAPRKRQYTEHGKTSRHKAINNGNRASGTAAV